jgi:hypothetical protein
MPESGIRSTLQPGTLERGVCLMIEDDAVNKGQLAP